MCCLSQHVMTQVGEGVESSSIDYVTKPQRRVTFEVNLGLFTLLYLYFSKGSLRLIVFHMPNIVLRSA